MSHVIWPFQEFAQSHLALDQIEPRRLFRDDSSGVAATRPTKRNLLLLELQGGLLAQLVDADVSLVRWDGNLIAKTFSTNERGLNGPVLGGHGGDLLVRLWAVLSIVDTTTVA